MEFLEMVEVGAFVGSLFVRYKRDPTTLAVDLLKLVSRVATMSGVELDVMLDAVRAGAGRPARGGR